jgi:beta-glucosidase
MIKIRIHIGLLLLIVMSTSYAQEDEVLTRLLNSMTLDEKIGQLSLFTTDWESTGPTIRETYKEDIRKGQAGALFNSHTVPFTKELQRIAVEETRLKIPLLFGYDVVHGYRTIFPIPLAESCSWNMELMESTAQIAAKEAAAAGLHWSFAPMVDISRDPRWGRVMEGAGEDTWLGSRIAEARVKGFQGKGLGHTEAVMACVKHFVGYGAATAGRDYHYTEISPLTMRELYLPPFKAAVDAGVATVMTSFNDISGIPASAHDYLLNEVLKSEWGFEGFVVTDYTSINELVQHGYARDENHAGELSINAGVDMDMQGGVFQQHLHKLVIEGKVSEQRIDEAVMRILKLKKQLGLFDDPYKYSNQQHYDTIILHPSHRAVAKEMAIQSAVLLRNNNATLPLSKSVKQIALIGPLAESQVDLLGPWSAAGEAKDCISLMTGLSQLSGLKSQVKYARGTGFEVGDKSGFEEAIQLAIRSDVVIYCMGEHRELSGEATSRANPNIPGEQMALFKALKATGKPIVVVIMAGRPLILEELANEADAILWAWFMGVESGPALAELLFGDRNPSGKLTMTFPRHVGQIPIYYNERNSGRPFNPNDKWNSKYIDMPNDPLYPFGYGLSYTTFQYSNIQSDKKMYQSGENIKLSVQVQNTGKKAGTEIVQFYIRDLVGSTTRPIKELRGFERVELQPGEIKTVSIILTPEDLSCYNKSLEWVLEPGEFHLMAGSNSKDLLMTSIQVSE